MPAALAGPLDRVRATLATLTFAQKATVIALVLGIAVGGFVFVRWVTAPTYEPLFSNLSSTDASAIVDELNAEGVSYQLPDGSGTIMVPKDQVYSLRLTMAGLGLPAGSDTGYSLLDEQGITTSEFEQQTTYQRALEGELSNTLEAIDGVTAATVHIAMPKDEVFVTDESKPKASVLLQLRPGTDLSGEQVQSVTHLVSSSVDGMEPDQVTVSDSTGRLLSSENGAGAGSQAQADDTSAFEQRLATNAQNMLDRALGAGNAVVTVAASLDFDQSNSTSQTYSYPQELPALAETTSTEQYTGTGGAAAGVLGTDGAAAGQGGDGSYNRESTTANNPVDTTTTTTIAAPGSVERLTVSVLMNSAGGATVAPGTVQDLVSNAVALDPARGDAITVASMAFDTSAADAAAADLAASAAAEASDRMWSLVKTGSIVGGLLLLVLLVWWRNRKRQEALADEDYEALELEAGDDLDPLMVTSTRDARLDLRTSAAIEALERQRLRGEITSMIEAQPDAVASTLRGWLAESRT
ncbi:flagellar M-ring protein FliF [Geodermatophilaceae bacterium NBWT11]|jgi:flagellar M-ring protein FliF|nr:flagellar M-ring protein FliF [Geodermatophilaceae bacterium NBWT11]